jgi:hypothetical protein
LQDYLHYTYFTAKEHTNENTKPKANSAAAPGKAATTFLRIDSHIDHQVMPNETS